MPHRSAATPAMPPEPDRLVVLAFADELLAFALRNLLIDLEEEGVIEVGDAVVPKGLALLKRIVDGK